MDAGQGRRRDVLEQRGKSWGAEPEGAGPAPNGDPDPRGRGEYDPDTGISDWYEIPEGQPQGGKPGRRLEWVLAHHYDLLEQDLHEHYGIDLEDEALLAARSWRWLRARIHGLLNGTKPTRLSEALSDD